MSGEGEHHAGIAKPTRVLIAVVAAGVSAWTVWAGRDIRGLALLAAVLVVVVHPIRRPIDRRGLPGWVGNAAVVATAYLALAC